MARKTIPAHVVQAIKDAAEQYPDTSAAQIKRTLEMKNLKNLPSERTILRYVDEVRGADTSDPWNPSQAETDAETTRYLLDALRAASTNTKGGTTHLTGDEAQFLTLIHKSEHRQSRPIPPWEAYRLAREYVRRDGAAHDLDLLLAFRPWRSQAQLAFFLQALDQGGWLPTDILERPRDPKRVAQLAVSLSEPDTAADVQATFGSAMAFFIAINQAIPKGGAE